MLPEATVLLMSLYRLATASRTSIRWPSRTRLVAAVRRGQLAILGVDPRADHQLEQLLDGKRMQAHEHTPTSARLLIEPWGFRIEQVLGPTGVHDAIVGRKTPTTQAGFLTEI